VGKNPKNCVQLGIEEHGTNAGTIRCRIPCLVVCAFAASLAIRAGGDRPARIASIDAMQDAQALANLIIDAQPIALLDCDGTSGIDLTPDAIGDNRSIEQCIALRQRGIRA
jgi:hypothetical protein